jgi:ribosome-associated protein
MNLDQFLKWSGVTPTGGQAKLLIQAGQVRVNGEVESRRGRGLKPGDRIEVEGRTLVVPETGPGTTPSREPAPG